MSNNTADFQRVISDSPTPPHQMSTYPQPIDFYSATHGPKHPYLSNRKVSHQESQHIYHHIDHHLSNTTYYKNKNTLHKIRAVMFAILAMNWASILFSNGPFKFVRSFAFYTIWNETFVFLYFFCLVFLHPLTKRYSNLLVNFQHQVITSQFIVVLVFWGVLFPNLGLTPSKGGWTESYLNIYMHTFPFFCILHEFLVTYGLYQRKGIHICMYTIGVYAALNLTLSLVFNFTAYPTPATDPHNAAAYVSFVIMFVIVYGVGRLFIKIKRIVVTNNFRGNFPEEYAEILTRNTPHFNREDVKNSNPFGQGGTTIASEDQVQR